MKNERNSKAGEISELNLKGTRNKNLYSRAYLYWIIKNSLEGVAKAIGASIRNIWKN